MEKKRQEIFSPSHKVGIKILSETQMENVFPNYRSVLNHIEMHRKWLEEHQIRSFGRYQYNLMYDNILSIFGARGTGKTSVAFTLHKMLEEDTRHPYDIVLPIIIPEVIPSDSSMLGWLLAIVKDLVLDFEQSVKNTSGSKHESSSTDFWRNCKVTELEKRNGMLSDELDRLTELFYAAKYNPANESSYNIAIGNSVKQSQNYYEFAKAIVKFWDHWIEMIREQYRENTNSQEEIAPLIFFVFDDVDLAPQKVDELLSIIIKYLSHPNIVVLATADEEMFLEVIEERLDRDIGRLPKEWRDYLRTHDTKGNKIDVRNGESGELVRKTARRYLGKVMPTSTRYYLKLFNTVEEKRLFHLDDGEGLWEGVCKQIDILLQYMKKSERENFLTEGRVERDYYLNFFGNTSRQIGNAYIGIKDLIESLCKNIQKYETKSAKEQKNNHMQYVKNVYSVAWRFLYTSINSNHNLAEVIEDVDAFIGKIFWLQRDRWYLFINYAYLDNYLHNQFVNYSRLERVKIAIQLFSLFHFTEHIFLILEKCTQQGIVGRKKIHGVAYLRVFLSEQAFGGRKVFRAHMDAKDFFAHYKTILNRIECFMENEIQEKKQNKEYFYNLMNLDGRIPENLISEAFRKDQDWLSEISGLLSAVYGNLYLIGKAEIENCMPYKTEGVLVLYQRMVKDFLRNDIYAALDNFDCLMVARESQQNWATSIKEKRDADNRIENMAQKYIEEWIDTSQEDGEEDDSLSDQTYNDDLTENEEVIKIIRMSELLRRVKKDLEQLDLNELINLLPAEEAADIAQSLQQEKTRGELISVLRGLYGSIAEWDKRIKAAYVRNLREVDDIVYNYNIEIPVQKMLTSLVDYLYQYIPEDYEELDTASWFFASGSTYGDMKEIMNDVNYIDRYRSSYNREDAEWIADQLDRIGEKIDAAILLEDLQEVQEAICFTVRVQLAIKIQRLYLYHSITEKYEQDYEDASKELEEDTYYYVLFKKISNMLHRDYTTLEQEEKAIRRFISRAASQGRRNYISSLLREVDNEAGAD